MSNLAGARSAERVGAATDPEDCFHEGPILLSDEALGIETISDLKENPKNRPAIGPADAALFAPGRLEVPRYAAGGRVGGTGPAVSLPVRLESN